MSYTPEQLGQLTREELLALLLGMLAKVESLERRVAELEAENGQLRQQLDKNSNSRNSSQPPARDQKSNQPADKTRKKHGPPYGHQKYWRPLVDKKLS